MRLNARFGETMSKLLEELRQHERQYPSLIHAELCGEAANEIERLHKEIEKSCDDGRFEDVDWSCPRAAKAEAERDELKVSLEEEQANAARAWSAHENVLKQLVCIQEAMTPCARFVMWALVNGSWQGCDLDGGSVQDKAVELGLIHAIPYNPEIHASSDCCEAGDEWFVPTEIMERALSRLSDDLQK